MKRSRTRNQQFVQRIPADVKAKVRGMKLAIPLGSQTVAMTVSQMPGSGGVAPPLRR